MKFLIICTLFLFKTQIIAANVKLTSPNNSFIKKEISKLYSKEVINFHENKIANLKKEWNQFDVNFDNLRPVNLKIIEKSKVIDSYFLVAIQPPYKGFPNVVIFKNNNGWETTFEQLSIGIQSSISGTVDLHWIGLGADMTAGKSDSLIQLDDRSKAFLNILKKQKLIGILYPKIYHTHLAGEKKYTINMSNYHLLAQNLLGKEEHHKFLLKECTAFDVPKIKTLNFKKNRKGYNILVKTNNYQSWKITFDGIDSKGYIINKKIFARK